MTLPIPTPDEVNALVGAAFPMELYPCHALSATEAVARYPIDQGSLRPGGFVSGPTQFGLADAALWYLVFGAIGRFEPMALTSELSMRFLRPAQGEVLWARATLDSAGRRNVVGTVRLWFDEREHKAVSVAQGTYALPATPTPAG